MAYEIEAHGFAARYELATEAAVGQRIGVAAGTGTGKIGEASEKLHHAERCGNGQAFLAAVTPQRRTSRRKSNSIAAAGRAVPCGAA